MTNRRNLLKPLLRFHQRTSPKLRKMLNDRCNLRIRRFLPTRYWQSLLVWTNQRWLIVGLAIVLWACQIVTPAGLPPMAALNRSDPVDASIYQLRTGDLRLKVVDRQQRPLADATVQIEQLTHEFPFGTALSTEQFQPTANKPEQSQYLSLAKRLFNAGVHENALKWYATESVQNQVSYEDADRILEWSDRHQFKMRGHTLFWAPEQWNPTWVRALKPQALREAVQRRTLDVCRRYQGRFTDYDVFNEPLHGDFYQSRLGDGIGGEMFRWCHTVDPAVGLYVNEYDILNGKSLDRYIQLIRSWLQQGVPISGIGVQGHIRESITADRIKASLDALAQLGLPIKITEFDAVAATEQEQARILKDVYRIAFAHPAVTGIFMWGFWQGAHWEPEAAIFKQNFEPKLSATQYQQLVYHDWWTRSSGQTDQTGNVAIRAFFGNYQVTVKANNQTFQQTINFSSPRKSPQTITITAM
ncbi:endo-1,4-beta-xylanase [Pantanalinema rosaneae CENA516]|uniref:endo-1,4-beta-xylanase n=1 Tax=Pantanalinema rosaneae TaxID=1620701 RepID=UPI003D6DB749